MFISYERAELVRIVKEFEKIGDNNRVISLWAYQNIRECDIQEASNKDISFKSDSAHPISNVIEWFDYIHHD